MKFPVAADELVGRYVLLIGIDRADPHRAHFVAGVTTWNEPEMRVAAAGGAGTLTLRGHVDALRGFNPDKLPALLTADAWRAISALARGCDACVVGFATDGAGGVELRDPFFGIAMNTKTDEIFLMQGDDSE